MRVATPLPKEHGDGDIEESGGRGCIIKLCPNVMWKMRIVEPITTPKIILSAVACYVFVVKLCLASFCIKKHIIVSHRNMFRVNVID